MALTFANRLFSPYLRLIFDSSIDILKSRSHIINSLRLKKPNFAAIVVPK